MVTPVAIFLKEHLMDPDVAAVVTQIALLAICFLLVFFTVRWWWMTRKERKAKALNILRARFSALDAELETTIDEAEEITDILLLGVVGDRIKQFSLDQARAHLTDDTVTAVMTTYSLSVVLRKYLEYKLAKEILLERDAIEMKIAGWRERAHIRDRARQAEDIAAIQLQMLRQAGIEPRQLELAQRVSV